MVFNTFSNIYWLFFLYEVQILCPFKRIRVFCYYYWYSTCCDKEPTNRPTFIQSSDFWPRWQSNLMGKWKSFQQIDLKQQNFNPAHLRWITDLNVENYKTARRNKRISSWHWGKQRFLEEDWLAMGQSMGPHDRKQLGLVDLWTCGLVLGSCHVGPQGPLSIPLSTPEKGLLEYLILLNSPK